MRLLPLLLGAAAMASASASVVPARPLAVVHARAWTGTGAAPVENATILVDGGRILSVVPGGPVPAGAETIDAAGRPVTAGLINAATQIGLTEVSSADDTRDTAAAGDIGPSFDVSYALNGSSALVDLARADGLTRALSFPAPSDVAPFSGQASLVRLRNGDDILDTPRVAVFAVIGGGAWAKAAGSRAAQWQLLRNALDYARDPAVAAGDDKPPLNRRDAAALRRVLAGRVPLALVTHRESDIRQAIRLAADYAIRVVIVGGAEAWRAAPELAAAHIPVVLDPQANLPTTFDQLGNSRDNAVILDRAGVEIAFGLAGGAISQNYNAGLALREGAGLAVANGLPYARALKAVSANAAHIWGAPRAGTLTPGADADLVLWSGDPFEPSTTAEAVIVEGKRVDTRTRQSELVRRYRAVAAPSPK